MIIIIIIVSFPQKCASNVLAVKENELKIKNRVYSNAFL